MTLATALFGIGTELLNFAPTFVYVIFWLGVPLLSILFGNVWRALSPWRALADATVWLLERGGREARPVLEWSGRWGRYPAAAALFAFVALELANPRPAYPRTLAIASGALLVLGACGNGRLRPGCVDARRRGIRGRVRASLANRSVRGSGRSRRRALALHGARRRRARPRDARLRGGHAGIHELRRVLAHDHVEQPHRRHPRGSGRIGTAHSGSRDDARERRGADARSWRPWRSRTSARSGRPAR